MAYNTPDGLRLKYGAEKAVPKTAGEYQTTGKYHEIEFELNLNTLTEAETILSDVSMLPDNVRVQEVEVVTITPAATGVAIDFGTIRADRTTEGDYNGLLAAFPIANMNVSGEYDIVRVGHANVGLQVGTTVLDGPYYFSASMTTAAAFTAGQVRITVRYFVP